MFRLPGFNFKYGGAKGGRTPDLLIANETLYQLSYGPTPDAVKITWPFRNCKPRLVALSLTAQAGKLALVTEWSALKE